MLCKLEGDTTCRQLADIVLVLDQSTSIVLDDYENWYTHVLGFATDVAKSFEIGPTDTQIAVLKFSDIVEVGFYLDAYDQQAAAVSAIQQLDIRGGDTNIAAALRATRNEMFSPSNGARSGVSKVVFLVTDGTPTADGHLTVPEAEATKNAGIEIFAIGVTTQVNRDLMLDVASEPTDSHVYFIDMFDELLNVVDTLVNESCGTMPRSAASSTARATTPITRTATTASVTSPTTTGKFQSLPAVDLAINYELETYISKRTMRIMHANEFAVGTTIEACSYGILR